MAVVSLLNSGTSDEVVLTVPTGLTYGVTTISLTAVSGTPTVTLSITSGSAPSANNAILWNKVFAANESFTFPAKRIALGVGNVLYVKASSASALATVVSYTEL